VLALKEQLGLFDDPYRRCQPPEPAEAKARRGELARKAAVQSLVLLTNPRDALPLASATRRLALIGPLADAAAEMRGSWIAAADEHCPVSVLAGLSEALGEEVRYALGVSIDGTERGGIEAAAELCEDVDAVILCLGERGIMSGEAASRAHLDLPGLQRELAISVLDRAESQDIPVIVVLFSGRPLTAPWLFERADAVIAAWFPGAQAGHAIADVLLGKASPSGRTPISWPRAVGQIPIFYAQRSGGRPFVPSNHYTSQYLDVPNDPQFPFGHGLTYGRFEYSNLRVSSQGLSVHETIEIYVEVRNTGPSTARETVFLFIHDPVATVARPVLELKAWRQIELHPGQSANVTLQLAAEDLRFLDEALQPVYEPGDINILIGPCADRAQLTAAKIRLV
jgi:beta-glucosidase